MAGSVPKRLKFRSHPRTDFTIAGRLEHLGVIAERDDLSSITYGIWLDDSPVETGDEGVIAIEETVSDTVSKGGMWAGHDNIGQNFVWTIPGAVLAEDDSTYEGELTFVFEDGGIERCSFEIATDRIHSQLPEVGS